MNENIVNSNIDTVFTDDCGNSAILEGLAPIENLDRGDDEEHVLSPWPSLDELGLGAELAFVRRSGIGGSDANVVLSGDEERILRLWREKRGEVEPEDLSSVLPVMLGSWTEAPTCRSASASSAASSGSSSQTPLVMK